MTQSCKLSLLRRLEADAIVPHRHRQVAVRCVHREINRVCVRMTSDVAQSFLRDPESAQRDLLGQSLRYAVKFDRDLERRGARQLVAFGAQRIEQAEIFEGRGMQAVGYGVNVLTQSTEFLADVVDDAWAINFGLRALQFRSINREPGKTVAE